MATAPSPRNVVFPLADVAGESVGGPHPTMNLPGYPARDFMAPPGTPVVAPEAGTILRFSGRDPSEPATSAGGAWGLSEYLQGESGTIYYFTHLGGYNVKEKQKVIAGQPLGTVGDFPGSTPDHVHIGTQGPVSVDQLMKGTKFTYAEVSARGTGDAGAGILGLGVYPPSASTVNDAARHIPGVAQVEGAVGAIGSVGDALKFLLSYRMLEIVGGLGLVAIGVIGLVHNAATVVPGPVGKVAGAIP